MKIVFNYLGIHKRFNHSKEARVLIEHILHEENRKLGAIQIIFTDNHTILSINTTFLKHSYFTDVITFVNSRKDIVSGEIYISIDQVAANSRKYRTPGMEELFRVIIHGVLHLIGYVDEKEEDRKVMRMKEDLYLCHLRKDIISGTDELVV